MGLDKVKLEVPWEFERDRSTLIVIDMQNDFVREGAIMEVPEARRQIPRIKKLIDCCREMKVPVIYTMQVVDPVLCPLEVIKIPFLKNAGMREGTEGVEIISELAPQPGDIIIKKRRFSAFYNTELELVLNNIRGQGQVDTLIICGTVTNICCESTVRDAFFRDYKVVFGSDINSALDEDAHNATLRNVKQIFGRVMDCESIIAALKAGRGSCL